MAYSSGAIPSIQKDPHIECSPSQISWFGSIITIGAAVGSLAAGPGELKIFYDVKLHSTPLTLAGKVTN